MLCVFFCNSRFEEELSAKENSRSLPEVTQNMGCITSKVMSKSLSFKEELNQSLQRRSNSISSIQELIISGNKSDQFLNLLCSANMVDNKLQSESLTSETPESDTNPKPDTVHVATKSFRALDLATNEGQEEQWSAAPLMDVDDLARRSKSCHWSPEIEVCSIDSSDTGKKLRGQVRSIHTVEEYDAILEKLWLSRSQQAGSNGADGKKSTDEASQKEKRSTETRVISSDLNADKGEAQEQNSCEKGLKRKAVAKGLESLSLPQTIEFQNVGSLKDWLQVYSPVTPKFGSYALPSSTTESKGSESVAFNAELIAAFEECMQQLQAEEEIILKQIAEDLEDKSNNDKQAEREEENPSHLQDIQVQI